MLKRTKIISLAALAAVLAFTAAMPAARAADDTVVAVVNGDKIYKKDVMEAMKQLPVQDADREKVFPMVVDQLVGEKLLDAEAAKANVTNDPDYKKRLDVIKAQLVKQVYLENALKDKVSDAAVKSEYDKFKKDNAGKEEIHARHILVPTEEEAKQVIKDLQGGAKFEDLAKQRSSGPTAQNGGDLGWFAQDEMVPEFSAAAFKLKKGEYSKAPVKSQFGWHVIEVLDRRPRAVPDFKDVEPAIRNKLGQQALIGLVNQLRAKADVKEFDINGKPLEAAPADTSKAETPKKAK